MLNRSQAPPIVDAVAYQLRLKPVERATLDNGTPVYMIDAGAEEVLQLEWVYPAGNSYETKNLVAATTNFLLRNGTSTKTALQINEAVDYYGAYLNRSCFNEQALMTLHCMAKHVDALLPVVRELLTDSVLPEDELQLYRQNMKQRLEVNLRKADFVAGRLIDTYLFGPDHPYGKFSSAEAFDTLERSTLLSFYDTHYRKARPMLFVAGKIPAGLLSQLNAYFGDLPATSLTCPEHPFVPATQKKYRIDNDPHGVQGAIRMARPFPNRHHPDFIPTQLLNAVLGGFFGSRLMSNIREDKGYTYGIHSYLLNLQQESAWMISTEAGKEVTEATLAEVYREMERLRNEPIDEEELLLVRNYMMGGLLGDLDGPFQLMGRWKNLILHGMDGLYFYKTIDTIKTVSATELQTLANRYLQPDAFYELVVV
ncbi:MAG: M16 family metallopeptidase [Sphingomonadales bacterium]